MENNETNSNWTPPAGGQGGGQPVPNAMGAFILGIIGLSLNALCCCYGQFPALICSVIGLILGSGAMKAYEANPSGYDEKSYKKAKTGRMLSIIGLIVSLILVVILIVLLASGSASEYNYERMMRKYR